MRQRYPRLVLSISLQIELGCLLMCLSISLQMELGCLLICIAQTGTAYGTHCIKVIQPAKETKRFCHSFNCFMNLSTIWVYVPLVTFSCNSYNCRIPRYLAKSIVKRKTSLKLKCSDGEHSQPSKQRKNHKLFQQAIGIIWLGKIRQNTNDGGIKESAKVYILD